MSISVELPDGSIREYENSVNPGDVAADISRGLAKRAIGAVVDGQLWELNRELPEKSKMELILENDERAPQFFRHTFSHILAQAVIRVYGIDKVRLGIGPVIENGFYYDFDLGDIRITEEDLVKIENEMEKIIKEDHPVQRIVLSRNDAKKQLMEGKDQDYKLELLNEFEGETFSFYSQGEFTDLCRGPHVPSTGRVKYFKLTAVSGAYWRGDESRPMLQRVYGTAFIKKSQLEEHLRLLEEAKKRDHRKLGPQLGLFTFNYDFAPGMPLFLPKGTVVLNELYAFSREMHTKYGYQEINTPLVMNDALWRTSGHWDHYQDNMYFTEKEDQHYALKPMNCPGHILVYKASSVSYKDFPLKLSEFGKVHRYERSGVLHGLFRVRGFTQDDAHIFCTPEQIKNEIKGVIDFVDKIYSPFGFEYRAELSTRPEDFMGEVELWDTATTALKESLEEVGLDYKINEGDGAFYGPKIDYHIKDSLGREWQCATIQLDFMMPERFQLKYITSENAEAQPVMIHRAIFGSIERFMGILVENFAGAFPSWLAPVQAALLPIADRHSKYAKELADKMTAAGIRVNVDARQKSTNYKVRDAQVNKIPYMLVIGDKEIENSSVAVRLRNGKNLGAMSIEEFIDKIKIEIEERKLNSIFE